MANDPRAFGGGTNNPYINPGMYPVGAAMPAGGEGMTPQDEVLSNPYMQDRGMLEALLELILRQTGPAGGAPPRKPTQSKMADTKGPIKAETAKKASKKRSDIMKKIP